VTPTTREAQLTDAFVALANSLVTDYDVVDLLNGLVDRCLSLFDAAAAGLVLHDQQGGLKVLAASTYESRLLELLQLHAGQGPCIEAYATGQVVFIEDMEDDASPWPIFREGALKHGFRSVHAIPMRLGTQTIGALNLFNTGTGALPDADVRVAQGLADVATIAILQERALRDSQALGRQLQNALTSRVVIEQAKGVLAHHGNLEMDAAFKLLRAYARDHRQRLSDVAAAVVNGTLDLRTLTPPLTR
jgi:GAF domain-containing protein